MSVLTTAAPRGPRAARRPLSGYAADPEVALMLRVQRDEPGAFAELVQRYWTRVFGRFYRQLGDRQEAEDLAQDVFLRLYRGRARYRPTARFTTWLYHIAQNVARNALRTRRRKPCVPLGPLTQPAGDEQFGDRVLAHAAPEAPERPAERAELAGAVRAAMAHLATRQRTALELQFQDRSYSEIAAELAMTPKAAKSLLYRARTQLRETLTPFMVRQRA
jgi:RNA polymerase sigma-70 factor, ECF subfamily